MSPAFKNRYFITVIKFASVISVLATTIFLLIKGNFISRSAILLLIASAFLYRLWRHRHTHDSKYDEIGYWSGLDDFELGIDSHIFNDLDIIDDDLEILSGEYYDRRPF